MGGTMKRASVGLACGVMLASCATATFRQAISEPDQHGWSLVEDFDSCGLRSGGVWIATTGDNLLLAVEGRSTPASVFIDGEPLPLAFAKERDGIVASMDLASAQRLVLGQSLTIGGTTLPIPTGPSRAALADCAVRAAGRVARHQEARKDFAQRLRATSALLNSSGN